MSLPTPQPVTLPVTPQHAPSPTPAPVSDLTKQADTALSRARIAMMGSGAAFITSVCFSLKQVWTFDVPRAATDGMTIYYNPKWFMQITHHERTGVVVHETWHVALNHCKLQRYSRMGARDPKLWNIAGDVVINCYVIDAGFALPSTGGGFIYEPQYAGQSTEQIYAQLDEKQRKNEPLPTIDLDDLDVLDPPPGTEPQLNADGTIDDAAPGDVDNAMKQILVRAAMQARMAGEDIGELPGEIQYQLSRITNPKLPWTELTRRYFQARAKTEYSFIRPNRRYAPEFYLPSRSSETLDNTLMCIDMSGSVTDEQTDHFIGEVISVMTTVMPKQLDLLEFDTQVSNVTRIHNAQQLRSHNFYGGGGTRIDPVIAYANEHPTDLLVIFTDGHFYPPSLVSTSPVLWIIFDNPTFHRHGNQGKVIHVSVDY